MTIDRGSMAKKLVPSPPDGLVQTVCHPGIQWVAGGPGVLPDLLLDLGDGKTSFFGQDELNWPTSVLLQ